MWHCLLSIAFDDGSPQYALYASTAREADEWITMLQQATCVCVVFVIITKGFYYRYQHLLSRLAELRGRLLQITGKVCMCIQLYYCSYMPVINCFVSAMNRILLQPAIHYMIHQRRVQSCLVRSKEMTCTCR